MAKAMSGLVFEDRYSDEPTSSAYRSPSGSRFSTVWQSVAPETMGFLIGADLVI